MQGSSYEVACQRERDRSRPRDETVRFGIGRRQFDLRREHHSWYCPGQFGRDPSVVRLARSCSVVLNFDTPRTHMPLAENMSSIHVRTWAGERCIVPNVPVVTLVILEPLGYVGSACFTFVCLLPPGATWTRPRQPFMAEQRPLRSRQDRLELPDLDTDELAKAARPDRPFELMALLEF